MLKKIISSFFILFLVFCAPFSLGMAKVDDLHYCDTLNPRNVGGSPIQEWITIEYDSYTVSSVYMNRMTPLYEGSYLVNSCAPVAGISILGYHDVNKDNLIPNFTAGYESVGTMGMANKGGIAFSFNIILLKYFNISEAIRSIL